MNTICPHCKRLIPYSARWAGRPATCPECHQPFEMPSPDEQAKLLAQEEALKQEQTQRFEHARERRGVPAEAAARYPALRFIAGLLQFLAGLALVGSLLGLALVALSGLPGEVLIPRLIQLTVVMVLSPVLLWGLGELIYLLIDMANDIHAARQELTRLRRKKS
jgi:hypothetical protein